MQLFDAFDHDVRAAFALDMRAHFLKQAAKVDDLGFARGVVKVGPPAREDGGHDRVFSRADRHHREGEVAAGQAPALGRGGANEARGDFDLGADRFKRLEVEVDGPVADSAAARQRHGGVAGAGEQRPQHQDRRAHPAHHVIGRDSGDQRFGLQRHPPADLALLQTLNLGRHAKLVQEMAEAVDVGEARQVAERQLLVGEDGAGEERQRAVLGARDRDDAFEPLAALDDDGVHEARV